MTPNLLLDAGLAPVLAARPLTCLDVGSRGGFEPDLLPIAGVVDAIGFEPEPTAFAALSAQPAAPWRSLRHLPEALAGSDGERLLGLTEDITGASLLPRAPEVSEAFGKDQFTREVAHVTVRTRRLDDVVAEAGIGKPVYLKLDVEGVELEILEAAPRTLEGLLAIKTEVSFLPFRRGQPLARDVEAFLAGQGFELMDLMRPHHWRVRGYVIHPFAARQSVPYSRGQLVQGDFLFFRRAETITDQDDRLRAAALAMTYGFFDHAARLLGDEATRDRLQEELGVVAERLLDRCSRAYGRRVWREEVSLHLRRLVTFSRSLAALWGNS